MVMNSRIIYGTQEGKDVLLEGTTAQKNISWEIEGDKDGEHHKENSEI